MISTKLILKSFALVAFIIVQQGNEVKSDRTIEYAVIIDAGSTGSRVLAYYFIVTDGSITLTNPEYGNKITPGLSEYLSTPDEGVETITKLLIDAKNDFVPQGFWSKTMFSVRLTGVLRKHSRNDVHDILEKLVTAVNETGFESNNNPVDILSGTDEARFSWFAVNFLTDRFNADLNNTTAVIELGGGSVQVAYIPTKRSQSQENIEYYVVQGKQTRMYCNCFSDLGLMSGRVSTFINAEGDPAANVTSVCIHKDIKNIAFQFDQKMFYVSGATTANGFINYQSCKSSIETYVNSKITKKPEDLNYQTVVAISYFHDIAQDAGLVDNNKGNITVQDLYTAAENECKKLSADTTYPYKCLDYTYNAVLLEKGFGLSSVNVLDRVNNHQISWTLGFAYDLLQKKTGKHESAANN